jgi:dihydropyrimidine dehydrogenase (NAD+) subunit PreT
LPDSQPRILAEQLPRLSDHEALVEANRCLYCYDAPCSHACPTHIDVPRFIKKISTANVVGSARTILESNLIGATCARVCPVEELCEGACVLNSEHKPIMIGRLQRYAMDHLYDNHIDVFHAVPPMGPRVAVVGAGPAGLSCAGELARRGHDVTVFEKRDLGGGLSTYGIIVLREPVPVALAEVEMIARLGVKFVTGVEVSEPIAGYDAVFVATGLGATPSLGIPGEELVWDGLAFIERSKMKAADLRVGDNVVVIGAGNTAIDCATVAKRFGASRVTMVYRRTEKEMSAYAHEYEFIKKEGVSFEFRARPVAAHPVGLECARDASTFVIPADTIVKAIGQQKLPIASVFGLETDRGYIKVTPSLETSVPGIYAGGDCVRAKGAASTVMAAQDGKIAAAAIHQRCCTAGVLPPVPLYK